MAERGDVVGSPPEPRRRGASRRARWASGVALLLLGLVVTWFALAGPADVDGSPKVLVTAAGLIGAAAGVTRVCKATWGPKFDTGYWVSLLWLVGLALAAALADWLPLAEHTDTTKTLAEPGNLRPDLFSKHPLGTNNFSLDLLAQCIYGARVSLLTCLLAVVVSVLVGGMLGVFAGYYRGATDASAGILSDALLAVPPIILLVALAAVFGIPTGVPEAIVKSGVALAVVGIPTMVRLARANTLVFAQREFVLASRALGARHRRIIFRELVPNVALPLLSYASIIMAVLIIAEGSLSFLGLGLQQPSPTWGNMIAEADLTTLRESPHIALVPGLFMFLTVYAFNRVGERLRQRWDAREIAM